MKKSEAQKIVKSIESQRDTAGDATASKTIILYPSLKFDGSLTRAGTRIKWHGQLKRASSDLWDTENNSPDNAPNLWEDISYHEGYRIIPQIITAALAFSAGEIGYWPIDGKFYRAKNNSTVWTPSAYVAAWEIVTV